MEGMTRYILCVWISLKWSMYVYASMGQSLHSFTKGILSLRVLDSYSSWFTPAAVIRILDYCGMCILSEI